MHPELIQYGRGALVVVHACLPPVFGISSPFMCVSVVVCSFHTPDQTSAADSTFSAAYVQAYDSYPSSRWSIRCSAVTFATSGVDFDLSAMFAFTVPSLFHFLLACHSFHQSGALCAEPLPLNQQSSVACCLGALQFGLRHVFFPFCGSFRFFAMFACLVDFCLCSAPANAIASYTLFCVGDWGV